MAECFTAQELQDELLQDLEDEARMESELRADMTHSHELLRRASRQHSDLVKERARTVAPAQASWHVFTQLPDELLVSVFFFLPPRTLYMLRSVSSTIQRIVSSHLLWHRKACLDFPPRSMPTASFGTANWYRLYRSRLRGDCTWGWEDVQSGWDWLKKTLFSRHQHRHARDAESEEASLSSQSATDALAMTEACHESSAQRVHYTWGRTESSEGRYAIKAVKILSNRDWVRLYESVAVAFAEDAELIAESCVGDMHSLLGTLHAAWLLYREWLRQVRTVFGLLAAKVQVHNSKLGDDRRNHTPSVYEKGLIAFRDHVVLVPRIQVVLERYIEWVLTLPVLDIADSDALECSKLYKMLDELDVLDDSMAAQGTRRGHIGGSQSRLRKRLLLPMRAVWSRGNFTEGA